MDIWQAIILGIVQGLTEFLPVSSSGHLIIFPWLLEWETSSLSFDAALHLGTLLAVFTYFRRDIINMISAIPVALQRPAALLSVPGDQLEGRAKDGRLGLMIVIATIPGVLAGVFFESAINDFFHTDDNSNRAIAMIATMLIVVGVLMAVAERVGTQRESLTGMRWLDALLIGIAQAIAVIPGTSRSGATITAGLFRGLRRGYAARFSFLAGMPLILGAGLKGILDAVDEGMTGHDAALFIAGAASAAIVGFFAISGLLAFLQRQSTMVFVVYRILFGIFLFVMLLVRG